MNPFEKKGGFNKKKSYMSGSAVSRFLASKSNLAIFCSSVPKSRGASLPLKAGKYMRHAQIQIPVLKKKNQTTTKTSLDTKENEGA